TSPAPGNVAGTVTVTASATDDVGVAGVRFTIDGVLLGVEDTSAPYEVAWPTDGLPNGPHVVTAIARDAAGHETTASVNVMVSNDVTAPAVSLTSPAPGNVAGTVTVTASATDDIGVAGVRFTIDGVPLGVEDTSAPYEIAWPTAGLANGPHVVTAIARDAAGR